jgi:hypothetical protein
MQQACEKLKVKIPTSRGMVEVEGDINTIKKLLESYEQGKIGKLQNETTVRGQIINLIRDGFFDTPKTFIDIKKELERKGYRYKTNTLFPILFREFLQSGHLQRIGQRKYYQYFVPKEQPET